MKAKELREKLAAFPDDALIAIYDGDSGCYVPAESVVEMSPENKRTFGLFPSDRVVIVGD